MSRSGFLWPCGWRWRAKSRTIAVSHSPVTNVECSSIEILVAQKKIHESQKLLKVERSS
jgi:hypothetical protein